VDSGQPHSRQLRGKIERARSKNVVSRILASWNQLDKWLRQIEILRFVA
jgi:hypothetical protein